MLNKLMKLKNKKGFTLVELIVVIAIIAILTAIIVPLVGRYSAQARYTTLNDAATTVSNSINNGLSDANQIGVINVTEITGNKASGVLTVKVGASTSIASTDTLDSASTDSAELRAAKRICAALGSALPNGADFYAAIKSSTVEGVIYRADGKKAEAGTFALVDGFDNAYAVGDKTGPAVGLSGKYIPSTPGSSGGGSST